MGVGGWVECNRLINRCNRNYLNRAGEKLVLEWVKHYSIKNIFKLSLITFCFYEYQVYADRNEKDLAVVWPQNALLADFMILTLIGQYREDKECTKTAT